MAREYPSRVLRADRSARSVASEPVPDARLERCVGGKGLGARYLCEEFESVATDATPVPEGDRSATRGDSDRERAAEVTDDD